MYICFTLYKDIIYRSVTIHSIVIASIKITEEDKCTVNCNEQFYFGKKGYETNKFSLHN